MSVSLVNNNFNIFKFVSETKPSSNGGWESLVKYLFSTIQDNAILKSLRGVCKKFKEIVDSKEIKNVAKLNIENENRQIRKQNELILSQMVEDLNALKFTCGQLDRAKRTIKDFKAIHDNFDKIAQLKSEDSRNKAITEITHCGAEAGFSANLQLLKTRLDVFINTFLRAKSRNDLVGFFACFSKGDPCLNGRSESLFKYAASLDNFDIETMADPEKSLYFPGIVFSLVLMENFEEGTTLDEFKKYVKENLREVADEFRKYEKKTSPEAFLEYLEVRGLYKKGSNVTWESLLTALLASSYFSAVYQKAITFVVP